MYAKTQTQQPKAQGAKGKGAKQAYKPQSKDKPKAAKAAAPKKGIYFPLRTVRKGKAKKMKKYADQDEEDRKEAMLLLGHKDYKTPEELRHEEEQNRAEEEKKAAAQRAEKEQQEAEEAEDPDRAEIREKRAERRREQREEKREVERILEEEGIVDVPVESLQDLTGAPLPGIPLLLPNARRWSIVCYPSVCTIQFADKLQVPGEAYARQDEEGQGIQDG